MSWLNFQSYAVWINLAIFVVAAGLIWLAGSHISGYACGCLYALLLFVIIW